MKYSNRTLRQNARQLDFPACVKWRPTREAESVITHARASTIVAACRILFFFIHGLRYVKLLIINWVLDLAWLYAYTHFLLSGHLSATLHSVTRRLLSLPLTLLSADIKSLPDFCESGAKSRCLLVEGRREKQMQRLITKKMLQGC